MCGDIRDSGRGRREGESDATGCWSFVLVVIDTIRDGRSSLVFELLDREFSQRCNLARGTMAE